MFFDPLKRKDSGPQGLLEGKHVGLEIHLARKLPEKELWTGKKWKKHNSKA